MADSKPPPDTPPVRCPRRLVRAASTSRSPTLVKRYTASVDFDRRLAPVDIAGSLAHARMLAATGVLSADDLAAIERGMDTIRGEVERGDVPVVARSRGRPLQHREAADRARRRRRQAAAHRTLAQRPGRHRPPAVAARRDRRAGRASSHRCAARSSTLAETHAATIMPGYTHLQVAQPVTFGHHLLAYEAMFARDAERLSDCRRRVNRLPLGSAALAGTSYPIDRTRVARELGFDGLCTNSLDAVSDRDFADRIHRRGGAGDEPRVAFRRGARAGGRIRASRSCTLADRFCTGSSIMPQKKNPDVAELARGKTGRVHGHLVALLTLMKGQPLAYNRDNQEDKEPLFDTVDTLADTLAIMTDVVARGLAVDAARMRAAAAEGHATATDLADYLVAQGRAVPRRARGRGARGAPRGGEAACELAALSARRAAVVRARDRRRRPRGADARRIGREPRPPGGTAPAQVRAAAAAAALRCRRRTLPTPRPASAQADALTPASPPRVRRRRHNRTTYEIRPPWTKRNEGRRISRPGRHGLSDGRASGDGRAPGHRLQPLRRDGAHAGSASTPARARRHRRPQRRAPISC